MVCTKVNRGLTFVRHESRGFEGTEPAGLGWPLRRRAGPEQRGNAAKATDLLGWQPQMDFEDIVAAMVDADFKQAVNRVLAQLYRTGEVGPIYDRWFGRIGKPGALLAAMYTLNALPE